jgi:uncharacterized membrane protein YgdD (TMEM256/DUF423 family)
MQLLIPRLLRAAVLDPRAYEGIGEQPEDMFRALGVVMAVGVAFSVGVRALPGIDFGDTPPLSAVLVSLSTVLTGWLVYTAIIYILGTLLFRGKASFRQILRTLGIAYGPGVVTMLGAIPGAGGLLFLIGLVWILPSALIAVKSLQGYDWVRTFIATAVGWVVALAILPGFLLLGASAGSPA